jgi:hypothetical protein
MRRFALGLLMVAALLGSFGPALAWDGRHHGFVHGFFGPRVFVGPHFFVGPRVFVGAPFWYPYPYYPPWYPYPYYPPPVVVEPTPAPQVYAQAPPPAQQYWYYCEDPRGYYPYISQCPGGWLQVVPRTGPPPPGGAPSRRGALGQELPLGEFADPRGRRRPCQPN